MGTAYLVTRTSHKENGEVMPKAIGIAFSRGEAERLKSEDRNKTLAPTSKDGEGTEILWSIDEVEVRIPLSSLQLSQLNHLAYQVKVGDYSYAELAEELTEDEAAYLRDNLDRSYGMLVLPDEGKILEGEERLRWLAEHGVKSEADKETTD